MPEPRAICFTLPCGVEPKQSFRSRKDGRHYPTPKTKRNAKLLAALASPYVPRMPFKGSLYLRIEVRYLWRMKESKVYRTGGFRFKDTLPDSDNLGKQVCDVLQSCGFYANDGQIARLVVEKVWCGKSEVDIHLARLVECFLGAEPPAP